jgi:alanyl-tRNA synthetase
MTDRLYYNAPYSREFDASVVRVEPRGDCQAVWLNRTAFYPTSGGQPFDTGTIESLRVVDVVDEDGEVVHVVAAADLLHVAQPVHGRIDWARRFDHMQQHTGQHVLSAACARLFDVKTVSFHLGNDVSTIDVARELKDFEIALAEDEANQIIWEDRPVTIRYASAEEAAAMPLRKEPARTGTLRLIDVEGFDLSACGGTHVNRTGGIGVIAVSAWERFKGGQRLEFLCGGRALRRFRLLRDAIASSSRLLSVLPDELPASIERLQSDARDQQRAVAALKTELARYRAGDLAAGAEPHPQGRLVLQSIEADATELKSLASALVARPGFIAVLVSRASPSLIVVARSADVEISCHEIVTALTKRFGGRGGGKPDLAQGGGLIESPEGILGAARSLL